MIHRFRKTAGHIAPIIQGKNPTMGCDLQEESHPFRNLDFPNPLPREARERGTPDLILKGPNIELTITIKTPMGTITPNASRNSRLNEIQEREGSF